MKCVTSVERLAIAHGERIGIEKGIEKGIERGAREGSANLLKRLLTSRFGALAPVICARLAGASTEQIEQWGERVLIADSIEDVFREN